MKYIIGIIIILISCSPRIYGPNYNQGKTHNDSNANRKSIVLKEDLRMKTAMAKLRSRSLNGSKYNGYKRKKLNRKFI